MSVPVSVRHLVVGDALRRQREARGFSPGAGASVLGWSRSKLAAVEAGQRGTGRAGLLRALGEFGATRLGQEVLAIIAADTGVWWRKYEGALPPACTDLAAFLTCAGSATVYDSWQVPPLLQTPRYAQAVAAADRALGQRARAALPKMLADLQKEVMTPGGPEVRFIIGESALLNRVEDDGVMREQLTRLAAMAGTADLRVLPFSAAPHPVFWTPSMTLLEFPEAAGISSIVHLGGPGGGIFLLDEHEVASCARLLSDLHGMSLVGGDAARLIEKASGA